MTKKQKAKGRRQTIIIGVIPARFASTRFPGKPLININGKTMIQRVYEQAKKSKLLSRVIVATDNEKIFNAVKIFGGEVVLTSRNHKSGTDRIGEAISNIKADIVVNIQGDEPFIDPKNIDNAVDPLLNDKDVNVSTLAFKITDKRELSNRNVVKVIFDLAGNAIYFSRIPIPYNRDNVNSINYYKHIGLYVYRKEFLEKFAKMKPTRLETAEKLEQLRIIENGFKIKVIVTEIDSHSVDTKNDLKKLMKLHRA